MSQPTSIGQSGSSASDSTASLGNLQSVGPTNQTLPSMTTLQSNSPQQSSQTQSQSQQSSQTQSSKIHQQSTPASTASSIDHSQVSHTNLHFVFKNLFVTLDVFYSFYQNHDYKILLERSTQQSSWTKKLKKCYCNLPMTLLKLQ